MEVYNKNLYQNVLEQNLKQFDNMRIITGYCSSTFVQQVVEEFPIVNIEIYIGMSHEGIVENDHQIYCELMKNKNVKIYYQIEGIPNHMKLYDFSSDSEHKVFIGSANFSNNAFNYQQEILGEINIDTARLFAKQKQHSLACVDDNIGQYITFINRENVENKVDKDDKDIKVGKVLEPGYNNKKNYRKRRMDFLSLSIRRDYTYYNEFDFLIVNPKSIDHYWDTTGVNSSQVNKVPVLKQTSPNMEFKDVFPLNEEFIIYTEDGEKLYAKLGGNFNREIHFFDFDIYMYLKDRIGLVSNRPISYEDLKKYNLSSIFFIRKNKNEYIVLLKNKS